MNDEGRLSQSARFLNILALYLIRAAENGEQKRYCRVIARTIVGISRRRTDGQPVLFVSELCYTMYCRYERRSISYLHSSMNVQGRVSPTKRPFAEIVS